MDYEAAFKTVADICCSAKRGYFAGESMPRNDTLW
jgi:hypothetical protein